MARHIIYIPGLGDRYDAIRRLGLALWRRPGVRVTHLPMNWSDPRESYAQKVERIRRAIEGSGDTVTLVGESAGGAMAIGVMRELAGSVNSVVTVCGMNQGAHRVSPRLYENNKAFQEAMQTADAVVSTLTEQEKASMLTVYSSADMTVRPRDTRIDGVEAVDLRIPGHGLTIIAVLFFFYRRILRRG